MSNFRDVVLDPPDPTDISAMKRHNRRVLFYRALLSKAGFQPPSNLPPRLQGLFSQDLLAALGSGAGKTPQEYQLCATLLSAPQPTWGTIVQAAELLQTFILDTTSGYATFNQAYVQGSSSGSWADDDLKKILEMFIYPNGSRLVGASASSTRRAR